MLIVNINQIPEHGLAISSVLKKNLLNQRLEEGRANDVLCLNNPTVNVTVYRHNAYIEIKGEASAILERICPKCLAKVQEPITTNFASRFFLSDRENIDLGLLNEELSIFYLESALQEEIILKIEPYFQNHANCKGIPHYNQTGTNNMINLKDLINQQMLKKNKS